MDLRPINPSLEDVFVTLSRAEAERRPGPPKVTPREHQQVIRARPPAPPPKHKIQKEPATRGLVAIWLKEFCHIRRDPATLVFMFLVPLIQITLFGYALDTKIDHIPTVVFNLDGREEADRLLDAIVNTRKFRIVGHVTDEESFDRALASGNARVGIRIPPDYTDRLLRQRQTAIAMVIDGSDSQVATTAQSTAKMLAFVLSYRRAKLMGDSLQIALPRATSGAKGTMPIEIRTRLLYNPDLLSARFFVPGLVGIILQLVTLFLTTFAIVREREMGTLEQLFVTPVGRLGLLLGKMMPYGIIGVIETIIVLNVMVFVFDVPIRGSIALLLTLVVLFLFAAVWGWGLLGIDHRPQPGPGVADGVFW